MSDLPPRDDSVRTPPTCSSCQQVLHGRRGRNGCAPRPAAKRPTAPANPTTPTSSRLPRTRRDPARAVYQCPDCGTRYLCQQRCPDCNAFCTRTGAGGTCPCCQEVIWR